MPIILPYNDKYPKIAKSAFIAENAVIIGDVEIGEHASIWYNTVIRGDVNSIRIGNGTNIQDGTIIHVNRNDGPTIIGEGVTVGHLALLHGCIVESHSFIGMGAKAIDGCIIKTHGMLGAGALLTPNKVIEEESLWVGSPASFKRNLTSDEVKYIYTSKINYIKLASEYINGS